MIYEVWCDLPPHHITHSEIQAKTKRYTSLANEMERSVYHQMKQKLLPSFLLLKIQKYLTFIHAIITLNNIGGREKSSRE